jgi:hypothetical protein
MVASILPIECSHLRARSGVSRAEAMNPLVFSTAFLSLAFSLSRIRLENSGASGSAPQTAFALKMSNTASHVFFLLPILLGITPQVRRAVKRRLNLLVG